MNAAHVAAPFRENIQADVKALTANVLNGDSPLLVGFLANDDVAAKKYASWTKRAWKSRVPDSASANARAGRQTQSCKR